MIPTSLGEMEPLEVLPLSIKRVVERTDFYIVENEKTARKAIKQIAPKKSQPALKLSLLMSFSNFVSSVSELTHVEER